MLYLYILLTLIASALFSGMEIAFLSSDKLRLELDRSKGGRSAKILGLLYSRPDRFITTMLLGNNVALVIYGLLMAELMEPWLIRAVLLLAGQKTSSVAIRPALSALDLEYYLTHSSDDGQASGIETEVKIIQNAITFSGLQVRDCMLPRNEIVGVEYGVTKTHLEELFVRTGLSKIIVYREHIDEVIGYIHSSEMFRSGDWRERIVPSIFVPESMQASTLMKLLMQRKKSIAIVIDELGGTAGMVTLEDVVEEIFGDIEDEHDHKKRIAKRIDDHTYIFSGRMEIDDINEQFGLSLPEDEDFMTIAGFILHHHPSIPSQGEVLEIDGIRFEMLRCTSTKIVLVKMILSE